jgi:trigger factor
VKTSVEPLEDNKVKLSVEVDEDEFDRALDAAFKRIAREVRIPGFRPGKAPRRILEARVGADVARQEALREALPEYYARAVNETETDVIAPPEIDITAGQEAGAIVFDAVVEVRPKVIVPGYGSLRVTIPAPTVGDEEIDAQLERMRAQSGELQSVERPATPGDHVRIDIAGSVDGEPAEGLTADDFLYEVGSGAVVEELDDNLTGAKVGDILTFGADHPDPEEDAELEFRILVKDVQERVLPDLDDAWAAEASEFETLEDLRSDLRQRLEGMKKAQAQMAMRQGVIDALVELVDDEVPDALVDAEVERRAQDLVARLQAQGASVQQYLEATGQSGDDFTADLREQAIGSVKADLALRAVVEAENIDADDVEVDEEIERLAERMNEKPAKLRKALERADQMQAVRSDIKKTKALEWLAEHAEVVDEDGAPVDRAALEAPSDDSDAPDAAGTDDPSGDPSEEQAE